ncbi:hypothetical protein C5S36_03620 [Candidatus Methanophagaceae archaeon]|nr:hypothetical protein C5S36_03620 [Methanophagales archaeon]
MEIRPVVQIDVCTTEGERRRGTVLDILTIFTFSLTT